MFHFQGSVNHSIYKECVVRDNEAVLKITSEKSAFNISLWFLKELHESLKKDVK